VSRQGLGKLDGCAADADDDHSIVGVGVQVAGCQSADLEERLGVEDDQRAGHSERGVDVGTMDQLAHRGPSIVGRERRHWEAALRSRHVEAGHRSSRRRPGCERREGNSPVPRLTARPRIDIGLSARAEAPIPIGKESEEGRDIAQSTSGRVGCAIQQRTCAGFDAEGPKDLPPHPGTQDLGVLNVFDASEETIAPALRGGQDWVAPGKRPGDPQQILEVTGRMDAEDGLQIVDRLVRQWLLPPADARESLDCLGRLAEPVQDRLGRRRAGERVEQWAETVAGARFFVAEDRIQPPEDDAALAQAALVEGVLVSAALADVAGRFAGAVRANRLVEARV